MYGIAARTSDPLVFDDYDYQEPLAFLQSFYWIVFTCIGATLGWCPGRYPGIHGGHGNHEMIERLISLLIYECMEDAHMFANLDLFWFTTHA